jgi:hypothetical protein
VPLPPELPVDLSFLRSPAELDEQRRGFLAGAIYYARWTSGLADEVLGAPDTPKSKGPELKRYAPLIAASAASACAHVAELLAAWPDDPPEPRSLP